MYNNNYQDNNIYDNMNINNLNNNRNINNNFVNNISEQKMLGENIYLCNNLGNDINNIQPILNPYLNSNYNYINNNNNFVNANNNNFINNNNNFINTNNNLSSSVNLSRSNNIFNNSVNNPESLFNLIQTNPNPNSLYIEKSSLTPILCSKDGIKKIKNLLKNQNYNKELIRNLILVLNKENGLHKIFKNIYGNYFIQHLFSKMNDDLIQLTIDLISSEFVNIAKSQSGTHCLQELLNYVNNTEKQISIIKSIKYKEIEMAYDQNATYVLKKIISIIPDSKRTRLNNIIIENTKELSLNVNSVFIIKQFISTITIEENKKRIINNLKKNFLIISQNPFGNYVIQFIFDVWPLRDCIIIVNEILDKANDLCCNRFSFNIVIKALNILNLEYKNKLIYILCFSSNVLKLLNDKYGNIVINKVVNYMDSEMKYNFKTFLELNFKNTSSKDQILINQIIILLNN